MAYDAFLKIEGVEGESTRDKHEGEIEILSFSWGYLEPHHHRIGDRGRRGPGEPHQLQRHEEE